MPITRRSALAALSALAATPLLATGSDRSGRPAVTPMRLAVVGAGWLGGSVGWVWVRAGHEVLFSSRHPEELKGMTAPLGPRATVGTPAEAAAFGEVILLAVPYDALPAIGRDLREAWAGKIVLDACNPSSSSALAREAQADGVGRLSAHYLPGVRLVRAFSAVDATAIEASAEGRRDTLGVPLAGDDTAAIDVAARLVRDAGCEPVIVGDLSAGRVFERGQPGFRANTTAADLRRRIGG